MAEPTAAEPAVAPLAPAGRIAQIDVVRGFALFGVLWMNLYEHAYFFMPEKVAKALFAPPPDAALVTIGDWFMQGKAQALFSLLFGFGFAAILSRLEARGVDGERIFLRRTAILLCFGVVNFLFLWMGDILFSYALMGLALFLVRRWSERALLWSGLALALLGEAAILPYATLVHGRMDYMDPIYEQGNAIRWEVFRTADYPAYVRELYAASFHEWFGTAPFVGFHAKILGRFMLGAWIFRQGWMQRADDHAPFFRRVCAVMLPVGLCLGALQAAIAEKWLGPEEISVIVDAAGDLATALGYGAGGVLLCRLPALRRLTNGLGDAGRMALTNYLTQSVLYVLLVYGVGLGLLAVLDPVLSLQLAVAIFSAQVVFSHWWLARFRFGPLEWVWRSLTYGARQPMRRRGSEPSLSQV